MAKKKKEEMAEYECVVYGGCTIHVENPNGNGTIEKLFRMNDGDVPDDQCKIVVPKGTVVCQHFEPLNEVAEEDRDDQMEDPVKYAKTETDAMLLAEIMVKKGFFRTKKDAFDAIEEEKKAQGKEFAKSDDVEREELIAQLSTIGKDVKETRQKLNAMLKDGDVTGYFKGAEPYKLAELVVDNELYSG